MGADVDDRASAPPRHPASDRTTAVPDAVDVGGEHVMPCGIGRLEGPAGDADTGIVQQHVDLTELRAHLLDRTFDVLDIGHLELYAVRANTEPAQLPGGGLGRSKRPRRDRNRRTRIAERFSHRTSK